MPSSSATENVTVAPDGSPIACTMVAIQCAGSTPPAIRKVLARFTVEDTVAFFAAAGVVVIAAFITPHIEADEFGNQAHYGYGLAVDQFDGHRRLRHTGGMISFASALEVDTDSGVGVFASVNAMQGIRPRPVAEAALRASQERGGKGSLKKLLNSGETWTV